MKRLIPTAAALLLTAPLAAQQDPSDVWERAWVAWEGGDYVPALEGYLSLLESPAAERFLEPVALATGELFRVEEVAPDGRGVRWSPAGDLAAFETASEGGTVTHLVDPSAGARPVATLPGEGLAFSGDGAWLAYVDRKGGIRLREVRTGKERALPTRGIAPAELALGPDGREVFMIGIEGGPAPTSEVYRVVEGAEPRRVSEGAGFKTGLRIAPGGRRLVYGVADRNPYAPGARGVAAQRFTIHDLASGRARTIAGSAPALSADGGTLAYLAADAGEFRVEVLPLSGEGEPRVVARAGYPLASPALSPDGSRIVFQGMPFDDWELFVVASDGQGEPRPLTREIQHDLFPRFVSPDTVLAVMGEGRHRRSYLYDATTGERTRLFHNNTVRTIAPEYEWEASPDGRKVLIVSERDGNTVSPERGVYLLHLDRRVSVDEVRQRLRGELAAERSLAERGRAMFAPIAERVRERTEEVSIPRLYAYQEALYDFGSKYITQPGNRLAAEYLAEQLRKFGYEPELQWFEARDRRSGETVRTANVIATLRGAVDPELTYVVSSHFDSVERGPGADDNSSGTSVLLETARVLAGHPQPATIRFAFFTGEEAGLLGSREFVRRAVQDGTRIVGALNNDMLGWSNDHRLDNTIRYSNPGIRDLQHAAAMQFSDLITYDALYYKNTDAHAYYEVYGDIVGGIGSYPVLGNPNYHQATDRLETMNQELIAATAKANIASIMLLASSPSRLQGLRAAPAGGAVAARWEPAAESDVASYAIAYGPPEDPMRHTLEVREPRARLPEARAGWSVAVRAVDSRGLHAWDWARATVER